MTDFASYVVSARQVLSSKQVPDSGRVCSECRMESQVQHTSVRLYTEDS